MIKIYHKTTTIKAEQFDGSDEMVDKYDIEVVEGDYADDYSMPEAGPAPYFRYFMPSGYNEIYVGDWVATGAKGEHWAIANDIFKKTYAKLPVIPEEVSLSIEDWKKHHLGLDQIFGMVYQYEITRTQGSPVINWIMCGNQDTFARAWLDEYVVEENQSNV